MDKFEKILDIIDHQEKYSDEEIREILQDEECRKLYQTMVEVDSALLQQNLNTQASISHSPDDALSSNSSLGNSSPNIDEEWEKFSQEHQLQEEATHPIVQEESAQVRKSVDGPPGMLTEDHHHTVHEERQVCYSSHLRPKSLHL